MTLAACGAVKLGRRIKAAGFDRTRRVCVVRAAKRPAWAAIAVATACVDVATLFIEAPTFTRRA